MKLHCPPRRGFALVLVLAFLVLITGAILALTTRATLQKRIALTNTSLTAAQQFSESVADLIIGDLLAELQKNSEWVDEFGQINGPFQILAFSTKTRKDSLPSRVAPAGSSPSVWKLLTPGESLFPGARVVASSVGTDRPSLDRRAWSVNRWFGSAGPGLGSGGAVPAWVIVGRSGIEPTAPIEALQVTSGKSRAIGRFAFVAYETGGLLDANSLILQAEGPWKSELVSPPGFLTATGLSYHGRQMDASKANKISDWLLTGSKLAFPNFSSYADTFLLQQGPGSLRVGDQTFVNRRDLLDFLKKFDLGLQWAELMTVGNVLPRAPAFEPSANAEDFQGKTDSIFQYQNLSQSGNKTSDNRLLTSARASEDFRTLTGEPVAKGAPMVAGRFPLSRLQWIGKDGPTKQATDDLKKINNSRVKWNADPIANEASLIRSAFGLRWNPTKHRWDYINDSGALSKEVKKLGDVSGREPNFFELLKAVTLHGSLGATPDLVPFNDSGTLADPWYLFTLSEVFLNQTNYGNRDAHVLQIAANIIDQADADSFPTRLAMANPSSSGPHYGVPFNEWEIIGSENLPMVFHTFMTFLRTEGASDPHERKMFRAWMEFSLFNPYQGEVRESPKKFRLSQKQGYVQARFQAIQPPNTNLGESSQFFTNPPSSTSDEITWVFPTDPSFMAAVQKSPVTLSQMAKQFGVGFDVNLPEMDYTHPTSNSRVVGLYAGAADYSLLPGLTPPRPPVDWYSSIYPVFPPPPDTNKLWIVLEADYGSGQWHPIQHLRGYRQSTQNARVSPNGTAFFSPQRLIPMIQPDFRTERFGNVELGETLSQFWNKTLAWDGTAQKARRFPRTRENGITLEFGGSTLTRGTDVGITSLMHNRTPAPSFESPIWRHRDGVRRNADGWTGSLGTIDPMGQNLEHRPVILNRPFRSVGELGYVFRDEPFMSLNFSSAQSADLGLLDVFCVEETFRNPQSHPRLEPALSRINLNSSRPEVVSHLLRQAKIDPFNETARFTNDQAIALANALVGPNSYLRDSSNNPTNNLLRNASDVAAFLDSNHFPTSHDLGTLAWREKGKRESLIRSLAGLTQTSVWHFLIDIVVQIGGYPVGTSSLENFAVDAERRYWLHLSIDRTTGAILRRHLEPVYE